MRQQEQNVNEKLNLLFGQGAPEKVQDETSAAYETVEEGMTTDTTDIASEQEEELSKSEKYKKEYAGEKAKAS